MREIEFNDIQKGDYILRLRFVFINQSIKLSQIDIFSVVDKRVGSPTRKCILIYRMHITDIRKIKCYTIDKPLEVCIGNDGSSKFDIVPSRFGFYKLDADEILKHVVMEFL